LSYSHRNLVIIATAFRGRIGQGRGDREFRPWGPRWPAARTASDATDPYVFESQGPQTR